MILTEMFSGWFWKIILQIVLLHDLHDKIIGMRLYEEEPKMCNYAYWTVNIVQYSVKSVQKKLSLWHNVFILDMYVAGVSPSMATWCIFDETTN